MLKKRTSLYGNIVHLFLWQGSTYLVPLIVTPYLARVLGLESYGIYGFSLAVVAYGVLFSDWGFNLSATQKAAKLAHQPELLRELFWNTLLAKLVLAAIALVALVGFLIFVPELRAIWGTLLASSVAILATALSANWFLQGLQLMGTFAASAVIGRLFVIPLTLLFVHGPGDLIIAAGIQAATQLLSAAVSMIVSARAVDLRPLGVDLRHAFEQVKDGWYQFISSFSISLYTSANAVFVGLLAGAVQAGLLTSSQRIAWAFQGLAIPINIALYPQIIRLIEEDQPRAVRMMAYALGVQASFTALLSLALFLVSADVVPLVLGPAYDQAIPVLRMMASLPFLAGVTSVLGTNIMLPIGLKRSYTASLVAAGLVNVILLSVLSSRFGAMGGAVSAIVTELFLLFTMLSILYAKRSILQKMLQPNNRIPAGLIAEGGSSPA